jgi:hypothetical protein
MISDECEILRLKIQKNKVTLLVQWMNYPPKNREFFTEFIEIEAEKIYFENEPDLIDPLDIE